MSQPPPSPAGRDSRATPLIELQRISKFFGGVIALQNVTTSVQAGEVTCVLGDNGAGKSTFIKILAGVHSHDDGHLLMEGHPVKFSSPREAKAAGIATVYQDLAMAPLMSIWRNFFLGSEPTTLFGTIDVRTAKRVAVEELAKMGIDVRDPEQAVGTLSGGERQSVAIARAVYFGAKVLILDEPTAALGVKQSGVVLKYIVAARDRGDFCPQRITSCEIGFQRRDLLERCHQQFAGALRLKRPQHIRNLRFDTDSKRFVLILFRFGPNAF